MYTVKKWAMLFLAGLLLITAGCKDQKCPEGKTVPEESNTDFPGITVQVTDVYYKGDQTVLEILWRNETNYDLTYGESYTVEHNQESAWVSCAKQEETAFITIGYMLKAGESKRKTYTVSELFDVTASGEYRFKTGCFVHCKEEENKRCTLWTLFETENTAPVKLPVNNIQKPPEGKLHTPKGDVPLVSGGYDWTVQEAGGKAVSTIADQAERPVSKELLPAVVMKDPYNDPQGCLVRLSWEDAPDSVTYTCWPDAGTPEKTVAAVESTGFYAMEGSFVYEIAAVWQKYGSGAYGKANYYIHIIVEREA